MESRPHVKSGEGRAASVLSFHSLRHTATSMLAYRAEMEKHGKLGLTNEQAGRVATLLQDSDNVTEFVKNRLVARTGQDVEAV